MVSLLPVPSAHSICSHSPTGPSKPWLGPVNMTRVCLGRLLACSKYVSFSCFSVRYTSLRFSGLLAVHESCRTMYGGNLRGRRSVRYFSFSEVLTYIHRDHTRLGNAVQGFTYVFRSLDHPHELITCLTVTSH